MVVKQDAALPMPGRVAVADLGRDSARRFAMADAARSLARPDAAERVADAVLATIKKEAA